MNFLITLIILIIILGIIIFIHEFGHFISAKKSGVYVEEFSLGMGPLIWKSKKDKGGTSYSIRLLPIGGYVAMAEKDDDNLRKDQVLENKNFFIKLAVFLMGITFNFILAIVMLFVNGLLYGSPDNTPVIGSVSQDSAADKAGLKSGDIVKSVNGVSVSTWEDTILEISVKKAKDVYNFVIDREGELTEISVTPDKIKDEDGNEVNSFGISVGSSKKYGFVNALKYGINGFLDMFKSISTVLVNLFSGSISVNNLSGPVGIFTVVDQIKSTGLENIIYLIAYLSVNVGIINLLPIPVFDGGRVFILLIETIARRKFEKLENILNYVGFALIILLMLFVTFNDISRLF